MRRKLVIHPQFGLANRLRVLASAMVAAQHAGRKLWVVWEEDMHCMASFKSLFQPHPQLKVVDTLQELPLPPQECDCYNAMSIEGRQTRPPINLNSPKHIYIKTYCELNTPYRNNQKEQLALQSLAVSKAVKNIINQYDTWECLGIHIRSQHAGNSLHPYEQANGNWTTADQRQLSLFRSMSDYRFFVHEIDLAIQKAPHLHLFVCSDNKDSLAFLTQRYQHSVIHQAKVAYNRGELAVQQALADLLLLSRTKHILGSYGSSFSTLAQLIGGQSIAYSGRDFGSILLPELIDEAFPLDHFLKINHEISLFLRTRAHTVQQQQL